MALCVSLLLATLRLSAFHYFFVPTDHAQWQLNLIPIWVIDLPVSVLYYFLVPAPLAEHYVGPIWWASLPLVIWWLWFGRGRTPKIPT